MKTRLDIEKIARGLGAERRGKVASSGGYFGALQLLADIQARFRVPAGGGRPTDPNWTEKRLLPLKPQTLQRLEELTTKIQENSGVKIEVMQLAALMLEKTAKQMSEDETMGLVRPRRRVNR